MSNVSAVAIIGKSQYLIKPGDRILVDQLPEESGDVAIDNVLLAFNEDKVLVGQPYLKNVTIKAKVLNRTKGEKIYVEKFKAKSRYHKIRGYRSKLSQVLIDQIDIREK